MKKEYQKPQMVVENFMLSDYIAACTNQITFSTGCENTLVGEAGDYIGLMIQIGYFGNDCQRYIPDGADMNGIWCYHNTSGTYQVFAS